MITITILADNLVVLTSIVNLVIFFVELTADSAIRLAWCAGVSPMQILPFSVIHISGLCSVGQNMNPYIFYIGRVILI